MGLIHESRKSDRPSNFSATLIHLFGTATTATLERWKTEIRYYRKWSKGAYGVRLTPSTASSILRNECSLSKSAGKRANPDGSGLCSIGARK